jgi:hypothetical protein
LIQSGQIYSVRYEAVNAMLLNEFLKEHQKVQRLEAALAAMDERLKEQDAKSERVKREGGTEQTSTADRPE